MWVGVNKSLEYSKYPALICRKVSPGSQQLQREIVGRINREFCRDLQILHWGLYSYTIYILYTRDLQYTNILYERWKNKQHILLVWYHRKDLQILNNFLFLLVADSSMIFLLVTVIPWFSLFVTYSSMIFSSCERFFLNFFFLWQILPWFFSSCDRFFHDFFFLWLILP